MGSGWWLRVRQRLVPSLVKLVTALGANRWQPNEELVNGGHLNPKHGPTCALGLRL